MFPADCNIKQNGDKMPLLGKYGALLLRADATSNSTGVQGRLLEVQNLSSIPELPTQNPHCNKTSMRLDKV